MGYRKISSTASERRERLRLQHRSAALAYQARKKAAGLCIKCGKALKHYSYLCDACQVKNRSRENEVRRVRRAAHLCPHCGKSVRGKRVAVGTCAKCAARLSAYRKDRYQRLKAANLCVICAGKLDHYKLLCDSCSLERRVRIRNARGDKPHLPGSPGRKPFI